MAKVIKRLEHIFEVSNKYRIWFGSVNIGLLNKSKTDLRLLKNFSLSLGDTIILLKDMLA